MSRLTPRQHEVCAYLCSGLTNKEIAAKMNLSIRTVESHREALFDKFRVRNVVELVRMVYGITEAVG